MAHTKVTHDSLGETLPVCWAEPRLDQLCQEAGGGISLIKDAQTLEVIGLERLY